MSEFVNHGDYAGELHEAELMNAAREEITNQLIPVTAAVHPLRVERRVAYVQEGKSVSEVVTQLCPEEFEHMVLATINDIVVDRDVWRSTFIDRGDIVVLRAIPQGGGGGSKFLRFILTLAVIAIAFAIAGPLGGSLAGTLGLGASTWTGIIAAGINAVGQLAINALIPPSSLGNTPKFQLSGVGNTENQYGAVPRLYGRTLVTPPKGAHSYTVLRGNDTYLFALFDLGPGPIKITDIKIGQTPITSFEGVQWETREGRSTDTPLTLYTHQVTQTPLSIGLLLNGDTATQRTPINTTHIEYDVTFPGGLFYSGSDGKIKNKKVSIFTNIKDVSTGTSVYTNTTDVVAASNSTVAQTITVTPDLPSGQYDVIVTRTTAPEDTQHGTSQCYWTALRSWGPATSPILPQNRATIAVQIKASQQLNGDISSLNCIAQRYVQVWDGAAFSEHLNTHPAWAAYDVVTGSSNARPLDNSRIDLSQLKFWADTYPTAEFNYVFGARTTIWQALRTVGSAGRAVPVIRDGLYSFVFDYTQSNPVQMFTARNAANFRANKNFVDELQALEVRYVSETMGWQEHSVYVYGAGFNVGNVDANKISPLELTGVTSDDWAFKLGSYFYAASLLRTTTYSFDTDLDHLACNPGDRILVQHDIINNGIAAGRTKAITRDGTGKITALQLDETVTGDGALSYSLFVRTQLGTIYTLPINTFATTTNTYTLTTAFTDTDPINVDDLVALATTSVTMLDAVVKTITPQADFKATVTCLDYAPTVHSGDAAIVPPVVNTRIYTDSRPRPVQTVSIGNLIEGENVALQTDGGQNQLQIHGFFSPVIDGGVVATQFHVQYQSQGNNAGEGASTLTNWTDIPLIPGSAREFNIPIPYTSTGIIYSIRIRGESPGVADPSAWSNATVSLTGFSILPPQPSAFTVVPGVLSTNVNYTPSTNARVDHVKVYAGSSAVFGSATFVGQGLTSPIYIGGLTNSVLTYFWLTAVDAAGNESPPTGAVTATPGAVTAATFDTTPPATPTFPSTPITSAAAIDPVTGLPATALTVTWNSVADSDLDGYEIQLKKGSGAFAVAGVVSLDVTSLTVYDVVAGSSYTFQIRAIDKTGNRSGWSTSATFTSAQDITAPSVPTSLTGIAGIGSIFLTWTNPSDIDLDSVEIWENTTNSSGTATRIASVQVVASAGGSYARNGLSTGSSRYYWLKARDTSNNISGFSAGSGAVTPVSIVSGDFSTTIAAPGIGATLPGTSTEGQLFQLTTDGQLYRYHSGAWTVAVPATNVTGTITAAQVGVGILDATKFAAGFTPIENVTSLPSSGNFEGRVVTLSTDGKLYRYHSGAFTVAVPTVDLTGTISAAQITAASIDATKLASSISAAEIVATLPASGNYQGRLALLTTDNKLYRYTGSAWTSVIPATDITGTIVTAQIATGAVTATQIANATITTTQVANATLTGTNIAAATIVAGNIVAGTITALQIAANAITASKLLITGQNLILDSQYNDASSWVGATGWAITIPNSTNRGLLGAARAMTRVLTGMSSGAVDATVATGMRVEAGASYRAIVNTLVLSGFTGQLVFAFTFFDQAGVDVGDFSIGGTSYQTVAATSSITASLTTMLTAPAGAATVSVYLYVFSSSTLTNAGTGYYGYPSLVRASDGNLIVDGSVTAAKITANTITAAQIAAGTITATQLAANTITAGVIAAGAIGTTQLAANAVTAAKITAGTITANEIASATITGAKIVAATITGSLIAATTITASNIAADTITAGQIAASAIGTSELAAGSVVASKLLITALNLIQDGQYNDSTLWVGNGSIVVPSSGDRALLGVARALQFDLTGQSSGAVLFSLYGGTVAVEAGASYRVNINTLAQIGFTGWLIYAFTFRDQANADIGDFSIAGTNHNSSAVVSQTTQFLTTMLTAPAGSVRVDVIIYCFGSSTLTNAGQGLFGYPVVVRAADGNLIVDGSVTAIKIAANTITASQIASGTITGTTIAAATITASNLVANTITAGVIAAGAIGTTQLAANAVTAAKITAGTITTNEIAASTIVAANIASGTITATQIASGTITATQIASGTITATQIAATTILGSNIVAGTITASNIASGTITATQIAAGAITATQIAVGAINATNMIVSNLIVTGHLSANAVTRTVVTSLVDASTPSQYINSGAVGVTNSIGLIEYPSNQNNGSPIQFNVTGFIRGTPVNSSNTQYVSVRVMRTTDSTKTNIGPGTGAEWGLSGTTFISQFNNAASGWTNNASTSTNTNVGYLRVNSSSATAVVGISHTTLSLAFNRVHIRASCNETINVSGTLDPHIRITFGATVVVDQALGSSTTGTTITYNTLDYDITCASPPGGTGTIKVEFYDPNTSGNRNWQTNFYELAFGTYDNTIQMVTDLTLGQPTFRQADHPWGSTSPVGYNYDFSFAQGFLDPSPPTGGTNAYVGYSFWLCCVEGGLVSGSTTLTSWHRGGQCFQGFTPVSLRDIDIVALQTKA